MISVGTNCKVIDNSGALNVKCLKVLGNSKIGNVGSIVIVSVQKVNPLKKIKKGVVLRGVIVSTKKNPLRKNGVSVSFNVNGVVIVNNKNVPIGTRILGPVMLELRSLGFLKVLSLAVVAI